MYISQTLRRAVQLNGQGTATVFAGRRQTWREFEDRIACLANGLLSLGVNAGDRVAILALNTIATWSISMQCRGPVRQ